MDLNGAHWRFSLGVYARAGVAPSCLALQDDVGVDVNVLLLALYFSGIGAGALEAELIGAADAAILTWRADVVEPLRGLRRRLKGGVLPEAGEENERLRQRIKQSELFAEQIEQAVLASWFASRIERDGSPDHEALRVTARRVATFYGARKLGAAPIVPPRLAEDADRVAAAAHAQFEAQAQPEGGGQGTARAT